MLPLSPPGLFQISTLLFLSVDHHQFPDPEKILTECQCMKLRLLEQNNFNHNIVQERLFCLKSQKSIKYCQKTPFLLIFVVFPSKSMPHVAQKYKKTHEDKLNRYRYLNNNLTAAFYSNDQSDIVYNLPSSTCKAPLQNMLVYFLSF